MEISDLRFVALAGGVGGAKLADGLAQALRPEQLSVIVNTGDDFTHLGLRISPDLDTVCYTLAGLANLDTGWGRAGESWNVLSQLQLLGMPGWFQIGDLDLATHLARTLMLAEGGTLTQVTHDLCDRWGVGVRVFPMSDDAIQTKLETDEGELDFQEYFVHRSYQPVLKNIRFRGIESAVPAPGVVEAIHNADAVIFCPSNPFVSIDPILAVPGIKEAMVNKIKIAVSPIIGAKTVKGPAAKMFTELGIQPSCLAVGEHYRGFIHTLVIDASDSDLAPAIHAIGIRTMETDILMRDLPDRKRLACEIIEYIQSMVNR